MNNQEEEKQTEKKGRKLFPTPSKNKNAGGNNFYWIWIVVMLLFVGSYFYNSGSGTREITSDRFNELLQKGDVKEITVVNREFAEVTIRKEKLSNPEYRDLKSPSVSVSVDKGPHYF